MLNESMKASIRAETSITESSSLAIADAISFIPASSICPLISDSHETKYNYLTPDGEEETFLPQS